MDEVRNNLRLIILILYNQYIFFKKYFSEIFCFDLH